MYEITEIQDVSKVRCKRLVAHVRINTNDKPVVKTVIAEATQNIKNKHSANVCGFISIRIVKCYAVLYGLTKSSKTYPCQNPWSITIGRMILVLCGCEVVNMG